MVSEYKFGRIVVDGVVYTQDVIIMSGVGIIVPNWRREQGHLLGLNDLKEAIQNKPDTIVIGTGAYGIMKVPHKLIRELENMGLKVIVESTDRACEVYNELCEKGVKVIAGLHLTC